MYSSGTPVYSYTANKSTYYNVLYILEILNNSGTKTLTGLSGMLFGQNITNDVDQTEGGGLSFFSSNQPNFTGTYNDFSDLYAIGTTSFNFNITGQDIPLPQDTPVYIIVTIDIASTATTSHTLYMNGATTPILLTIAGAPYQINNQSNLSPIITIGT